MLKKVVLAFSVAISAMAAPEWLYVDSPNFELITTAGKSEARRVISYFEQVHDFYIRTHSARISRLPVTIILFRNMKAFRPYAPSEVAAAFYVGDDTRDYIVMSGADEDDRPVAVHEYMHLLIRRMNLDLPPWLNEGIADLYSTLSPYGGKVSVGLIPKGRAHILGTEQWMPLSRLLTVRQDSPEYNERQRAGAFYAQSWMLTHMLTLSEPYGSSVNNFVASVSGGEPSESAFQKIYGKTLADVDRDLKAYYRSPSLKAALFDARLQSFTPGEVRPASEFNVELNLARVSALSVKGQDGFERLKKLAAGNPDRWEAHEALGNVAWRRRDMAMAQTALRRAVDLKPAVWTVYWDYARVAWSSEEQKEAVLAALRRTVELNGANLDARLSLGEHLLRMDRNAEAFQTFEVIRSVTPQSAPRLFTGKGYALLRLNRLDEAREAAGSALRYAKSPHEIDSAQKILGYLDRRKFAESRRSAVPANMSLPESHASPGVSTASTSAEEQPRRVSERLSTVHGYLRQVDCLGAAARLEIGIENSTVSLLIANSESVRIRNRSGASMDLTCGAQAQAVPVTIEYIDKVDPRQKTVGEVRALEFGFR